MFSLARYIVSALVIVIVLLMVSPVDGGMIYASAYSDALNTRRSPALVDFSPSGETNVLPISPGAIPGSSMLGTASLSAPGLLGELLDVEDSTLTPRSEIWKVLADGTNAPASQNGLVPWIESISALLSTRRETDTVMWQASCLHGTLALAAPVHFSEDKGSIDASLGIELTDCTLWLGQPQLETPCDQAQPVMTAVDRDAIALGASLPKNDAPNRVPQDRFPRDAMLTPTVAEVVNRMLRDGDDEQFLNGLDELPRIAPSRRIHPNS
jgi:hypothetical protein